LRRRQVKQPDFDLGARARRGEVTSGGEYAAVDMVYHPCAAP
jgi:hypothetical protein